MLIGSNSDEGGLFMRQPGDLKAFEANIRRQYGAFADRALGLYPASDPETTRQARAGFRMADKPQIMALGAGLN